MVRVPSLVEGLEKVVRQKAKLYTSRRLIKSVSKGADDVEDGFECENIESYQDGNQEKEEGMEVMEIKMEINHERHFILLYNDFDPIKSKDEDEIPCDEKKNDSDDPNEKELVKYIAEGTLYKLAKALDGHKLYLPAYLDFRGRIYHTVVASCISTSAIYQEA
ncbi:hypothetical protein V6N12_075844 [Hibiscus sabdariffa]|uniref:Uncharacterized protein n=1 Tax=Hibiscus sabdariffa TaxID=183260 RepID=A0ABR2BED4_9ROSI